MPTSERLYYVSPGPRFTWALAWDDIVDVVITKQGWRLATVTVHSVDGSSIELQMGRIATTSLVTIARQLTRGHRRPGN